MIKKEYEKIIHDAISSTSNKLLDITPTIEFITELTSPIEVEDFNVLLGVVGEVRGQIIFGVKEDVSFKIISKVLGRELSEINPLLISGMAEFGNILAGNVVTDLFEEIGEKIDITPPSMVMGNNVILSTKLKEIVKYKVNYGDLGDLFLYVALGFEEK